MITFATDEDLKGIKELWKECFGDSDEYIDFFFSEHCLEKETLIYKEDSKVVGMLNLLPATMRTADGYIPVRYVYAVGTLVNYRGRGIAGKLLRYANQELIRQGIATILVPANEQLFQYYQKQGYQTLFYMKEEQKEFDDLSNMVTASSFKENEINEEVIIGDITPFEYKKLRDEFFEGLGYINWGISEIEYAIKENEFLGGKTKKIIIGEDNYFIMYYIHEGMIVVKESSLSASKIPYVFQALAEDFKCNQIKFRSSKNHLKDGTLRPFGMFYGNIEHSKLKLGADEAYLNLVLD